jgi:hypothetical protein
LRIVVPFEFRNDRVAEGAATRELHWEMLTHTARGAGFQFRGDVLERRVGEVADAAAVELAKLDRACCNSLCSVRRSTRLRASSCHGNGPRNCLLRRHKRIVCLREGTQLNGAGRLRWRW